jgi:hypothetical protein
MGQKTTEPMMCTLHTDPDDPQITWVTVDRWKPTTLLSPSLINTEANGGSIRLAGTVRITVANGDAEYRVVGWDESTQAIRLELIAATGPT